MDSLLGFSFNEILNSDKITGATTILVEKDDNKGILRLEKSKLITIDEEITSIFQLRPDLENAPYFTYNAVSSKFNDWRLDLTYPAEPWQIERSRHRPFTILRETPEMYETKTEPLVIPNTRSKLAWVDKIISGEKEADRVIYSSANCVVLPDLKWNINDADNMQILVIFTDPKLRSIRDLNGSHIHMLQDVESNVHGILSSKYNREAGSYRMLFHYHPTFWHLHLHISDISKLDYGSLVDRAHLLEDVIDNLKSDGEYYSNRTISIRIPSVEAEMYSSQITSAEAE